MSRLRALLFRLRGLFRGRTLESELSEELRAHLEGLVERNLAAGMSPEEARYAALRAFGGVAQIQERARDARRSAWGEQLLQDLRYAARQLGRAPGFAATVIATLGLGIGACTVIFSTFDTLVRRAIDDPEPDRKVFLHETRLPRQPQLEVSVQTFLDWERQATSLEHLTASGAGTVTLRGESEPLRLTSRAVTGRCFQSRRPPACPRPGVFVGRLRAEPDRASHHPEPWVVAARVWRKPKCTGPCFEL